MSKVYLIRHGQASFLADDYDNLSDKGIAQSEILGNHFLKNNIFFDKIYIGNLKRHQQTYTGFLKAFENKNHKLPKPIYLEQLNEHKALEALNAHFDDFIRDNKKAKEWFDKIAKKPSSKKKYSVQIFILFMQEFVLGKFPRKGSSIQSWEAFRMQVKEGFSSILKNTKKGETIGVFTSGGTISSMLGECLELKEEKVAALNLAIRNTSFSQIFISENKCNVVSMNEIPHLEKEMVTFV